MTSGHAAAANEVEFDQNPEEDEIHCLTRLFRAPYHSPQYRFGMMTDGL
jgi:hypothetical protein